MDRRLELQALLEKVRGNRNVYFQPPSNLKLSYPAIVYNLEGDDVHRADDSLYSRKRRYQITLIDRNPDSPFEQKLAELKYCRLERAFVSDNLNHFVYTIYF